MSLREVIGRSVLAIVFMCGAAGAQAQTASAPAAEPDKPKVPVAMKIGDILTGQLTAMKMRAKGKGKRVPTYQIVSEPRRLPPPGGLCNLETGPETFQIVATSDAQTAQLKKFLGKPIALKVDQVACAEEAGVMSEAVVTKWSVVAKP